MSEKTIALPRSLIHKMAALLERWNTHSTACYVCGANLDTGDREPPHRADCPSVSAAKLLREMLTKPPA